MKDREIIDKGYKEFKPDPIHYKGIMKCFQKRFDDDIGKKYFININKWDWTDYDIMPQDCTYEFEVQLYSKGKHNPINLKFFNGWDIDSVEEHMNNIWNSNIYDYYEEWE